MRKFKVWDINYDLDEGLTRDELGLPIELTIEVEGEDEEDDYDPSYSLADNISDKTGWCIKDFSWEELFTHMAMVSGDNLIVRDKFFRETENYWIDTIGYKWRKSDGRSDDDHGKINLSTMFELASIKC